VPHVLSVLLAIAFLAASPWPISAQETVIRIDQDFTVSVANQPVKQLPRTFYIYGDSLMMESRDAFVLIRGDLKKTWIMTPTKQTIAIVTLDQIRQFLNPAEAAKPFMPEFIPTEKTKTIAELPCTVHQSTSQYIAVTACMTTRLPQFERFQTLFGTPTGARGIPLDITITMSKNLSKDTGQTTISQRVTRISRIPLHPSFFTPPTDTPTRG